MEASWSGMSKLGGSTGTEGRVNGSVRPGDADWPKKSAARENAVF